MSEMSKRLLSLRKRKQMTQPEVSALLGCSPMIVSNWENTRSEPDVSQIKKLAVLYGVSTDELLGADHGKIDSVARISLNPESIEAVAMFEQMKARGLSSVDIKEIVNFALLMNATKNRQ